MHKEALLNEEIHLKLNQLLSKQWGTLQLSEGIIYNKG